MDSDSGQLTIYTIGHSNTPFEDFARLLMENGVEVVVDVRSSPYSQFAPQYNRENLARFLAEVGLEYVFAGEYLGGRPKDPTCYKHGKVPTGKVDYLKLVDYPEVAKRPWYRRGLERLIQIAGERPTTIMCSEDDPHQCHRYHLITPTLEAQGIRVVHLRRKQETAEVNDDEPQQMSLF